jgi:hypothetical protein
MAISQTYRDEVMSHLYVDMAMTQRCLTVHHSMKTIRRMIFCRLETFIIRRGTDVPQAPKSKALSLRLVDVVRIRFVLGPTSDPRPPCGLGEHVEYQAIKPDYSGD